MGQLSAIELNIPDLGCAAYTSNLHKWLFSPKGTAVLWVSKDFQGPTGSPSKRWGTKVQIVPPVLSSQSGGERFAGDFEYTGTRDCELLTTVYGTMVLYYGIRSDIV
eukprot:SAG31_NODE_6068_length_2185_cov_1.495686_2_plen_107_part_00